MWQSAPFDGDALRGDTERQLPFRADASRIGVEETPS
jgi:hypothetical protein